MHPRGFCLFLFMNCQSLTLCVLIAVPDHGAVKTSIAVEVVDYNFP
jgi:hypothetical protein